MEVVVNQLNNLHLDYLDYGWVQSIYHAEFLEFGELPPDYEDSTDAAYLRDTLKDIIKAIDLWLNSEAESNEDKSWAALSHLIQHDKLVALLGYLIDHGCKNINTKEYRTNSMLASQVYHKLLLVPGYKAYHIYHSQLFANSLKCFDFPRALCNVESHFNTKELVRDVNSIVKDLRQIGIDLPIIMKNLLLSPSDMNFEDILSNLLDITGFSITRKLINIDRIELDRLTGVIYSVIDIMLHDANQKPNPVALKLLFKCLLPKFVASTLKYPKGKTIDTASFTTYSAILLSKYGLAASSGYLLLLEHFCYAPDGLERAEVRAARAYEIVGMMGLLTDVSYRKMVKWLLTLSAAAKINHRHIAMEILSQLLSNEPEKGPPSVEDQGENSQVTQQQSDASEDVNLTMNGNENEAQTLINTDDENNQANKLSTAVNQEEEKEEDFHNILQQRIHMVPHAEILRAIYERVHDESGVLRTRAISILTDCVRSDRPPLIDAIKELNGDGEVPRLMAVAARSVCDERATVRKAGATLVLTLLAGKNSPPPKSKDLSILVGLCRDSSPTVRTAAIAALGELVSSRPSADVIDAFLAGPLCQQSDADIKVQEQLLTLIQNLFIDRLRKFDVDAADPLPWMFLEGIIRQKMKKHLSRVCDKFAKSGNTCINHRLVDVLSTHLGVLNEARDLQCLLLLTCVARHVEYSDAAFMIEYYYKFSENEQNSDTRLLELTLEVLSSWSRFLQADERNKLREHLVKRLAAARDDGCRIHSAKLATQLDPDNLTWATELMQLSERRALMAGDLEEGLRAADLSLVAPVPPSPALLNVFLTALSDQPRSWDEARLGACVAAVGRLCVRSRGAAQTAAPRLAALLDRGDEPLPVRTNALLALSDICVRYTCIVEPLLGTVCGCLSSDSPVMLRRGASREITRLLLGGYLRMRAPFFYQYCALLVDEDHDVREPAEYYVATCISCDIIYNHFVECMLYFCDENKGVTDFNSRQLIYDVMLQRMTLVQRLNLQCKLGREILMDAVNVIEESGIAALSNKLHTALFDAITVLCGPRMKLPKNKNSDDPDDIDEMRDRLKCNIVSRKMKFTVADVILPAVLRLYSLVRPQGGQLTTYIVKIANVLLEDYEEVISLVIEAHEELMENIKQFQESIGVEPSFGNIRNLVTGTAPPDPETPRAPRRRPRASHTPNSAKKRVLRM